MRIVRAILPLVIAATVVIALSISIGDSPSIGTLLDPVNGFWQSAESTQKDFNADLSFQEVNDDVEVWFDERMVPHIKAANDYDLYFTQGYIHAYFRLWQMDLQTRAAAGRISEVLGEKALKYDRGQRRKGMVYGAEKSLKAMEAQPNTKKTLNAYRDGVNSFINTLSKRDYPVEYKLMGFEPETWTNIKTALLLMYMSDDLSGDVNDIGLSYYLSNVMTREELDFYFPNKVAGSTPVIPLGTKFAAPSLPTPSMPQGNVFPKLTFPSPPSESSYKGNGSNNWAVSGQRTQNGTPILCNDPHLSLNLPSLWFEVQLTAPGINTYGVSLPGAPGVIIGFNDNISWGFTNNYRDVKDYYTIQQLDGNTYQFNGKTVNYTKRIETIKVKGQTDFYDTVKYTVHGPLQYDENFEEPHGIAEPLALKWMALEESNELLSVYLLNRAQDYESFVNAVGYFLCPAQNFIYADTKGNIALWTQGQYINKWQEQGRFVMNGADSTTLWGQQIPVSENPHVLNPTQGFLSSANQNVTDTTYPYWYNGRFNELRAWRINEALDTINNVTVEDMFALQNDMHSVLARQITPTLLSVIKSNGVAEDKYTNLLQSWDYNYDANSEAATAFQVWWSVLYKNIWFSQFAIAPNGMMPLPERTAQILLNNKAVIKNADKVIVQSYKQATDSLVKLEQNNSLAWYKVKNTSINHLAKLKPFSRSDISNGGWGNTVNAMKENHGPSWRMVVQMNQQPTAYGIYPGGQSGNPGSKYYANFIDKWSQGEYNKLSFVHSGNTPTKDAVKYVWTIKRTKP